MSIAKEKPAHAALNGDQVVMECCKILGMDIPQEKAMNILLSLAGDFYQAERAYIFEYSDDKQYVNNTFEWCKDGIAPMISLLQEVPSKEVSGWVEQFRHEGAFHMSSRDSERNTPEAVALLEMQGIDSLVAAPIINGGEVAGFIGVDNPAEYGNNVEILKVIAAVAYNEILKRKQTELAMLQSAKIFADAFLKSYTSAYYVCLSDQSYVIVNSTDDIRRQVINYTSYFDFLTRYADLRVHEDDRETFREYINPGYIRERLSVDRGFSLNYKDIRLENVRWFRLDITRGSDADHVGIAFSEVTEMIAKEEQEKALMRENMELVSGLASEYCALFYLNIDKKVFKVYSVDSEVLSGTAGLPQEGKAAWDILISVGLSEIIHPDDRYKFEGFGEDWIRRELSHRKKSSVRFRALYGDVYLWTEMDLIKYEGIDDEANTVAIGFAERDKQINERILLDQKEDLANQQRHIKAFGDMVNAALWSMDIKGEDELIAVDWSDEFRHMFGYRDKSDFPNALESWVNILHPDDRKDAFDNLQESFKQKSEGFVYDIRYRVLRKSGEYCWYHALGRMEDNKGGTRKLFGIICDISAEKALEAHHEQLEEALSMAQSANRAKTTFLNNMSHDIRTPMNAIIGYTNLAVSNLDDAGLVKDYLGKIGKSSDHLLSLINDVLDMSRIESGKMHIEEAPENIKDIARTLGTIVQADIQAKRHDMSIEFAGVADENVYCDKLRLNQVLLNILSNAIKYTPSCGNISMAISEIGAAQDGRAKYEFVIRDNGIGMNAEGLKAIYEPFFRVKSTTVTGIQGTGLGMSITKSLVDMMGGQIAVTSEPGMGTEVTIDFEFRIADAPADSAESESAADVDVKGVRILLVEDNEINREIALAFLEEWGCVVTTADDGDVAVRIMSEAAPGDFSLVLMDVQMPTMNGYEATRHIRALGTEVAGIPIVAMTANAFEEDRRQAVEAGMNDHVSKPFDVLHLKNIIARYGAC